ncbi:FAD-dependent monooxygenase [Streptomyces tricolor]|nr:FAD-dependent monooxygenase [Streptomyces tricolor]
MIDRGDYWQCAALDPQGAPTPGAARPASTASWPPTSQPSPGSPTGSTPCARGTTSSSSTSTWTGCAAGTAPGLLCIGDAAHAMSPVFGIGVNLAVQDAVAAARHLVEPLSRGTVGLRDVRGGAAPPPAHHGRHPGAATGGPRPLHRPGC